MKTKDELMAESINPDPNNYDQMVFDIYDLAKLPLGLHQKMLEQGSFTIEYNDASTLLFKYWNCLDKHDLEVRTSKESLERLRDSLETMIKTAESRVAELSRSTLSKWSYYPRTDEEKLEIRLLINFRVELETLLNMANQIVV